VNRAHAERPIAPLLDSRQRFVEYVRRRINDSELAEDIVQDGLLRALKAAPDLPSEERLIPWFFQVLRNAVVDEYRKRDVLRRHVQPSDAFPDLPDASEEDDRKMCACFRPLLANLKPEYAELIELLEFGDETPERVAGRLGITSNNLKVRRHRARQALRQQLEAACGACAQGRCIGACTC
jgi:RNA polymerase sigma-70 factor (ECF subfamily)